MMDEQELHDILSGKTEVPPVKSLECLTLRPGDILVLTYEGSLTDNDARRLQAAMERSFPGRKVMILDNGADLKVLRDAQ